MSTRWTVRMVAVAASLALLTAACGSGEGSGEGEGDETSAGAQSPIGEFLGFDDFSDPEAAEQNFAEQEQQRQEVIASCMQEQGFEYVAYVDPRMVSFSPADEGGLEWGSKEWTEKYGYGVTTQWFSQDAVGPDLVGYESFGGGPEEESDDPNAEVYEGLSESEQTAYDAALWGDPDDQPVIDESLTEDEIQEQFENWEPSGCSAEGDDAVYGSQRSSEFYTTFSEELDELYQSMEADPRIVELQQKVADCVTEKGLEYVSEEDYWQQMEPVQIELNEGVTYPGQDVTPEEMEAMSEDELNELYSQPETLTEETRQRLAELQATEVELAVAAYDCGAGYSQNEDLYEEVQVEYEQRFLDDHADELEDFRATEE